MSVRAAAKISATEVARWCRVDLKTIHNWTTIGKISAFRTAGGHLRFHRLDVVEFLRAYGYDVPAPLVARRAKVCAIDADSDVVSSVKRALGRRFEVEGFTDPLEALVAVADLGAEAVILDDFPWIDAAACVARLKAIARTRHLRFVVYSSRIERRERALKAGASEFVAKPDGARLREALETITCVAPARG